jgi:SAM-dependent methyltransferase
MRIDDFDHTLVCDNKDKQTILEYFKNYRVLPEYIEIAILKIIIEELKIDLDGYQSVNDLLMLLPNSFTTSIIKDINSMFTQHSKAEYSNRHLSYLLYYLPANVFKIWKPLLDLQLKNILKPHVRILDIGTGPGSIPIGIIEYYRSLAESFPEISFSVSFTLIESEEKFLKIASKIIKAAKDINTNNLMINVESLLCKKIDPDSKFGTLGKYDLITMSNFLNGNEGDNFSNAVEIINQFKAFLEEDGALIIIEPGDELSSRSLKKIRNKVVNNTLNVFSPCIGIWEDKDKYNCQCFSMVRCFWERPLIYEYLATNGLSKAKRIDIPFNYVVLRTDKMMKYDIVRNSQHFVKLANLKDYRNQRVNIIALIRTVIKGDNYVNISLCDGSCEFSDDNKAIWVSISEEQLRYFGINIPLIAAEKITLRKVLVTLVGEKISLRVDISTRITIDY